MTLVGNALAQPGDCRQFGLHVLPLRVTEKVGCHLITLGPLQPGPLGVQTG